MQGTPSPSGAGGTAPTSAAAPAPSATPQGPLPGELLFDHPTQRPNEPVTAGLPVGPGPGPEANIGVGSAGMVHQNVASLLTNLARVPGATPDVAALANYAASHG